MKTDRFGLSVSTVQQSVIDALDHFSTQLLQNGTQAGDILEAAKTHPENVLLNCHSGILFLYTHDDMDSAKAVPFLQTAEKGLKDCHEREQLHYQAAKAWYAKDHEAALSLYEKITTLWPRDCVAAKFAEWLLYCMGQACYADRFLRITSCMYPHNLQEPGFLATHSFALELNHQLDESIGIAEDALALEPITPWAQHTIAHTLMAKSEIQRGIQLMEAYQPTWKNVLPPLVGHLTWHLDLFYLANLDEKNVLQHFSPGIWGNMPELSLEQIDAIALLWRMEMADMTQDDLLKKVTAKLGPHVYQQYIGFDTAHYVYALARAGETQAAQQVIHKAIEYAHTRPEAAQKLWLSICVPLFQGIFAYAQGHYQAAYNLLVPILPVLAQVGGSDAQIEIFYQTAAISLLRAGRKDQGLAVMQQYFPYYLPTKLGNRWSNI